MTGVGPIPAVTGKRAVPQAVTATHNQMCKAAELFIVSHRSSYSY
jgi:hypothetical protein